MLYEFPRASGPILHMQTKMQTDTYSMWRKLCKIDITFLNTQGQLCRYVIEFINHNA